MRNDGGHPGSRSWRCLHTSNGGDQGTTSGTMFWLSFGGRT